MKLFLKTLFVFFSSVLFSVSFANPAPASAVATTSANAVPGNLIQVVVSLALVVGLLIVLAVMFKKFGLNRFHSAFPVKMIGAMSIGNNQRIMVIEAGEEWIILGVTPHNISNIGSMPRQESDIINGSGGNGFGDAGTPNFATWMQATLAKYQGKKS